MPSTFSWVDFAEDDRQRIMEILHLFRDKEIREELGVGTVRDALSDILFSGTSTLHTRVKYMLLIPCIFIKLERSKTSSAKIAEYSRWDVSNIWNGKFFILPKDSIPCVYVNLCDFPSGYLPQFSAPPALGYSNHPRT